MINKYNENVYYSDPTDLNDRPALGYVKGDKYALMIDAGNSEAHAREFLNDLKENGLPYPSFVILTHSHWDHCYGLSAIEAPAISCRATYLKLLSDKNRQMEENWFEKGKADGSIEPFIWQAMEYEYGKDGIKDIEVILPSMVFEQILTIDLGNQKILCKHITSPHSDDSIFILAENEGVLFTGDGCNTELTGDTWTDHPDKVRQLRKELQILPFNLAVTAHHGPSTKTELLNWLTERL